MRGEELMFSFRPGKQKNTAQDAQAEPSQAQRDAATPAEDRGWGAAAGTSLIGPGLHWSGTLSGTGNVRIDGSFTGEIDLTGSLVIGSSAKVTADDIRATTVIVAGTVKGNIQADKIEIRATGRVYGDLTAGSFASEEGAFLRGQITMSDGSPESSDEPVAQPKTEDGARETVS
jgi:cytoskeletal protein CcmA (bactofilin family)